MKWKKSKDWDGVNRKLFANDCRFCGKEYFVPKHVLKKSIACSKSCSSQLRRDRVKMSCSRCDKEFKVRRSTANKKTSTGFRFCSRYCKDMSQRMGKSQLIRLPHYGTLDSSKEYRAKALRKFGELCSVCGYHKEARMLDVHHKDGDRDNNKLANLEVLCVWCHAIKTRGVIPHMP